MKLVAHGAAALLAVMSVLLLQPFASWATDAAPGSPAFSASFQTASDFFNRFDMGFSGQNPLAYGDGIHTWHGDHDMSCEAPTTLRDVNLAGSPDALDFSQLFWFCAPGGDATKGHVMTAVDTKGYNVAWFSPKGFFTDVSQVCWDINMTEVGARRWTSVLFVGEADATRYPSGTKLDPDVNNQVARGTGGFDLGYTDPDFRQDAPNDGIFPQGGTLAGYRDVDGSASWFQNQDTWMTLFAPPSVGNAGTDKATRFKHCLSNQPNNIVRITQDTPSGTVTRDMTGQIPQGPVRVVFADDNYNPKKDDRLNPDSMTWHWDNIEVYTGATPAPPPTTQATAPPAPAASQAVAPLAAAIPTVKVAPTANATTASSPPSTAAPTTAVSTTPAPTTASVAPTVARASSEPVVTSSPSGEAAAPQAGDGEPQPTWFDGASAAANVAGLLVTVAVLAVLLLLGPLRSSRRRLTGQPPTEEG